VINLVKYERFSQDDSQIPSKCFKVNDLQSKQCADESNPVKVNQTDLIRQQADGQAGQRRSSVNRIEEKFKNAKIRAIHPNQTIPC
jgi:hypothetical protein